MAFEQDCIAGLSSNPKSLPCKWLYDDLGSALFERICTVAEYYPARAEAALLQRALPTIAASLPQGTTLLELGSGASRKTRGLLDASRTISTYVPFDISGRELERAARRIGQDYPGLDVCPIPADFMALRESDLAAFGRLLLLFFPGSTLGNLTPDDAVAFLTQLRRSAGAGAKLLIGVDQSKDLPTLLAAYDDAEGVTVAFNLNLLGRMNRDLGCDIDISLFGHRATWSGTHSRIEMHLVCTVEDTLAIGDDEFAFHAGETVHTESSYKLSKPALFDLFDRAGWQVAGSWATVQPSFLLAMLTVRGG